MPVRRMCVGVGTHTMQSERRTTVRTRTATHDATQSRRVRCWTAGLLLRLPAHLHGV